MDLLINRPLVTKRSAGRAGAGSTHRDGMATPSPSAQLFDSRDANFFFPAERGTAPQRRPEPRVWLTRASIWGSRCGAAALRCALARCRALEITHRGSMPVKNRGRMEKKKKRKAPRRARLGCAGCAGSLLFRSFPPWIAAHCDPV